MKGKPRRASAAGVRPVGRAWGLGVLAGGLALFLALGLATASPAGAAQRAKTKSCRGSGSVFNFLELADHREVTAKGASCAAARKVAKRFPRFCFEAYSGQGRCKVRTPKRWRCRSKIVGPLEKGAPSRERCKRKRSRVKFTVAFVPPSEPPLPGPQTGQPTGRAAGAVREPARAPQRFNPYNTAQGCIDTSRPGTLIPPPAPAAGNFEVHVLPGAPTELGEEVQRKLVTNRVSPILQAGLGSRPRNHPARLPIYLTPREFYRTAGGVTAPTCQNMAVDAIVLRTNQPASLLGTIAAHEYFHAYSFWGIGRGAFPEVPWWEESSASWSEAKTGFGEVSLHDINLQYPNTPLDLKNGTHEYAMNRFVLFLEDRGLVTDGEAWPLQRQVIPNYFSPNVNEALAKALEDQGTTLGTELAAFWGDRIRERPLHGEPLKPAGPNANEIKLTPGRSEIPVSAKPLHTKFLDFTLDDDVRRVRFEFEPGDGFFWGAVEKNRSQRFFKGEPIVFCVGGSDQGDLAWPERFPVTFTNGNLQGGEISGKITVSAQREREQCTSEASRNRACKLLREANVVGILGGPPQFPFASEARDEGIHYWLCFYQGGGTEVNFNLVRFRGVSAERVRRAARRQIRALNLRRVNAGDIAGVGTEVVEDKPVAILVMAVGREIAFLLIGPGSQEGNAVQLARGIAGEL